MSHHRVSMRAVAALLVVAVIAAGCSKKDSGGPTGVSPAPPPPPPPPPPPTWTSLIGRSMVVGANTTQNYVCTQMQAPSDLYIKGFRTTASGVFRMLLTVSGTPSSAVDTTLRGDYPCSAGVHFDRILYVSGSGTPDFAFPAGVGVHVKAGQYLLLTILEYNPTAASENDSAQVSITPGAAADVTHEADIMLAGARHFTIPVGTHQLVQGGCSEPLELQIVAMAPMMNLLGTGQVVWDGGTVTDTILVDSTYSPEHQTYTTLQTPFAIHHNDQVIINCYYDNNTGHVVAYGETTDTENCYDAMYRYPAPDSASSYSCLTN